MLLLRVLLWSKKPWQRQTALNLERNKLSEKQDSQKTFSAGLAQNKKSCSIKSIGGAAGKQLLKGGTFKKVNLDDQRAVKCQ